MVTGQSLTGAPQQLSLEAGRQIDWIEDAADLLMFLRGTNTHGGARERGKNELVTALPSQDGVGRCSAVLYN